MKKGEKGILIGIGIFAVVAMVGRALLSTSDTEPDKGIPFYSTASNEVAKEASTLMRKYDCRGCHVFWGQRNIMRAVPAPSLDGIGSLKDVDWLYAYLSAKNPQEIVPSRLKTEFRMPSFADVPESERRVMAEYLASLKVKDWYLRETKKGEYEKLTGNPYQP